MNILVTGASGFIGRYVVAALRSSGHRVVTLVHQRPTGGSDAISGDFERDVVASVWIPRLAGIDAVVNAVGILRESGTRSYAALHVAAPKALFEACVDANVRKVVQISALGADDQARSRYHATKAAADRYLASLPLQWIVLQPSLVFGAGGASARLFATMASLPLIPLPGHGDQTVQPVGIDDLAAACVRMLERDDFDRQTIAAVGPRPFTVRDLLASMRAGLGMGVPRFVCVPAPVMRSLAMLARSIPALPLDHETLDMLEQGNVAPAGAFARVLGRPPASALAFLSCGHAPGVPTPYAAWAQLNWLLPLLRTSVALVWIATGLLSFGIFPVADSYAMLARVGASGAWASLLLYGGALADLLLGLGVLFLRRRRWLWRAQIVIMLTYSVIIAIALPEYWLHPFGPMLKNIPLLALVLALHELERRH